MSIASILLLAIFISSLSAVPWAIAGNGKSLGDSVNGSSPSDTSYNERSIFLEPRSKAVQEVQIQQQHIHRDTAVPRRDEDLFELQDVLTRNVWAGPQSGTSDKAWLSISSDAIGMNLVAGSSGAGRPPYKYILICYLFLR